MNISPREDTDTSLMLRFQAGEEGAFEELLEKHHRHVINFGYRFLGNKEEAEDLAQEVFLRVYSSKTNYRPEGWFTTWLYTIAANLALHWKRKKKASLFSSLFPREDEDKPLEFPDPDAKEPLEILEKEEVQKVIQAALQKLPPNQRTAVLLAKYEDMSMEEIGKVLGTSLGGVKQLLFRAKTTLAEKLKPYLSP